MQPYLLHGQKITGIQHSLPLILPACSTPSNCGMLGADSTDFISGIICSDLIRRRCWLQSYNEKQTTDWHPSPKQLGFFSGKPFFMQQCKCKNARLKTQCVEKWTTRTLSLCVVYTFTHTHTQQWSCRGAHYLSMSCF